MKFMMNFTIEFQIQILNIFYQNILMEAFLLVIQNTILEEHHQIFFIGLQVFIEMINLINYQSMQIERKICR